METLLSVRNLRVNFRLDKHTTFEAVRGISFDIPRNATVALVGESGSGKSVTSLSILGLLPKENSSVLPESEIIATWSRSSSVSCANCEAPISR